jgi:hypothetical protein
MTEHSFHGIHTSRFRTKAEGVTHVSGTIRHLCLGPLKRQHFVSASFAGMSLFSQIGSASCAVGGLP